MGRVYDALKRAESARRPSFSKLSFRQNGNSDDVSVFVLGNGHEHPWERSAFPGMPSAFDSASTAHTTEATAGPALPGGAAARDAGATLDAVGSARAVKFSTWEVLAARVEPLLIAEREHKRAFVITSAGEGESKTLTTLSLRGH